MFKKIYIVVSFILAVLMLAACGKKVEEPTFSPPPLATSTPAPEQVEVGLEGGKVLHTPEPTPEPTPELTPEPTPTPLPKVEIKKELDEMMYALDDVDVLSYPNPELGEVIAVLEKDEEVNVIGRTKDFWMKVMIDGQEGYVFISDLYIEKVDRDMWVVSFGDFCDEPTDKTDVITEVEKGDRIHILYTLYCWSYGEFNGTYGYIATLGLTDTDPNPQPEETPVPETAPAPAPVIADNASYVSIGDFAFSGNGSGGWSVQDTGYASVQAETGYSSYQEDTGFTMGSYARLDIPALNYSAPVCEGYGDFGILQNGRYVIAYNNFGDIEEIDGHNYQGFNVLYQVTPGMTAQLVYPDGSIRTLTCYKVDRNCTWGKHPVYGTDHVWDSEGNAIGPMDVSGQYIGSFIMKTCNENVYSNTVAFWY